MPGLTEFYALCAQLRSAADREVQEQTPPKGDRSPTYHCPACEQQRETRRDMRAHLEMCERFRDYVIGSTRRRDLAAK